MTRIGAAKAATVAFGVALGLTAIAPVAAADEIVIVHKDKTFTPSEIEVPAGTDFVIKVRNEDAKVIEFESNEMRVEKIVSGGREVVIRVRGLKPGTYIFLDEFNEQTNGKIIAK